MSVRSKYWPLLIVWVGLLVVLIFWTKNGLRPNTDLSQFLPRGTSDQDHVLLTEVRNGLAARTLLLRIGVADGMHPGSERLAAASRALAARLIHLGTFSEVANGDLSRIFGETDQVLFLYRYLIGPAAACAEGLDRVSLHSALKQRLDELVSGFGMLDKLRLTADPTACYRNLLSGFAPSNGPDRLDGIWVDQDRTHALLVAITAAKASDLIAQSVAVKSIEAAFAELPECQGMTLEMAGPSYFSVGSERQIKLETITLSTAGSILAALILALAFRSVALVLLGLLPLASGILVGIALVSSVFGFVHGITLVLGVTLLGVALDYPVHIYSHFQGRANGRQLAIWGTLMLSMVTTVLGYAALAWTSFEGLSQLGILTVAGLVVAALTALYLLPPLMPMGQYLHCYPCLSRIQHRLPFVSPAIGSAILLFLLIGLAVMVSGRGSPWETDIRRLSTVSQYEIEKDAKIRAQLGAPDVARLLYLVGADQADVLRRLEAAGPDLENLQQRGLIGGFDSAARWLPSPDTQLARQAALPDPAILSATLAAANDGLPFRTERFAPFLDAVETSRHLAPLTGNDLEGSFIGIRVDMLLSPLDGRWLGLVPLSGVMGEQSVAALKDLAQRHGMTYLNLWEGTAVLLANFFDETLKRLVYMAVLLLLILVLALRNLSRLLRLLLPIMIALAATLLLVLWFHRQANLFHMVSLLLVVGIGIDYSLFLSRPGMNVFERNQALFSVSIAALSSWAMFTMLSLSAIPALRAIGFTVSVGIAAAYLASLVLARFEKDWLNYEHNDS